MRVRWLSSASILASLGEHRSYLEAAWQDAQAAPLSLRKAMLAAMLVDGFVDRLFAATPAAGDILQFRGAVAEGSAALGLVMALAAQRDGFRMAAEAVAVPIADYGRLPVEDFMVSLYNKHSVQRLRIIQPDGSRRDALELLGEAMEAIALVEKATLQRPLARSTSSTRMPSGSRTKARRLRNC